MSDPAARDLAKLSPAEREKKLLGDARDVIESERKHIAGPEHAKVEWWGIGLSGGGIRSASLALGVLQSLAEHDLLRRFHFISTVSGGGYLGSSLQWWWSQGRLQALVAAAEANKPADPPGPGLQTSGTSTTETSGKAAPRPNPEAPEPNDALRLYGTGPDDFPYGPAHPSQPKNTPQPQDAGPPQDAEKPQNPAEKVTLDPKPDRILSFLRAHSSYLIPGHDLTMWSMIGVLLRTIIIAIATWLPLLTLAMGGLFLFDLLLEIAATHLSLQSPFGNVMPVMWRTDFVEKVLPHLEVFRYRAIFAVLLLLSYILACAFVGAAIVFALVSRSPQDPAKRRSKTPAVIWSLVVLALFSSTFATFSFGSLDPSVVFILMTATIFAAVAAVTLVADLRTDPNLNSSYMLRRWLETTIGKLLPITVVLFALGTIPFAPYFVAKNIGGGTATGIFSVAAGVGSALYGYYTFLRNIIPGVIGQIVATAGAIIYLYATIVFAYVFVLMLIHPQSFAGDTVGIVLRVGIPFSMLIAVAISVWSNINFVGLHRFYRDRLMEAFMPTTASVEAMTTMTSPVADGLSVAALAGLSKYDPSKAGLPFPIINANVILSNDPHQKYASRGGDNFIITPLHIGSTATGWRRIDPYIKMNGPLTLPSAMAASGAAASASAGYIGTGITTNPFVSAVMSLLNIRLGLWVGNPIFESGTKRYNIPTFLNPGLWSGVLQQGHTYDSGYLELTDGGHFENLGLYELVRRRTKVILIVDGEADPQMGLSSLVSATRRIEEDFKAKLDFADGMGPPRLMMYPEHDGADPRYPSTARYAAAPFIVGKLTYDHPTERDGILIYVKSTLIPQLDFKTAGYLALNPDFPHQSTVDQFFNSAQFDAYRCLGYESAEFALSALKGSSALDGYPALQQALAAPEAGISSPPPKTTPGGLCTEMDVL